MIFRCPECGKAYTIPQTDIMTDKQTTCICGCKTKDFNLIGRDIVLPDFVDIR